MILADTSVWVDHIRHADADLIKALQANNILTHPYVIGEVAMGNLPRRAVFIRNMRRLPSALLATDDEAMSLLEREGLFGQGIGYVDLHLLAATRLTPGATLLTRDRRLESMAVRLGLAAPSA
ncbi:MAG TPA: PIN domain-containing protein [Caulobacteraceae bacterium]